MASLNNFEIVNGDIHISREGWNRIAETTYREDYYKELTGVTWAESKGYLFNTKLGYLHRYIMKKWYGEDVLEEMTQKGWIVDHINNNGMDCRITNLEFLQKGFNTAKGQTFDIDRINSQPDLALNIFKDFNTGNYQLSLIFNKPSIALIDSHGNKTVPIVITLLYKSKYTIVLLDAEKTLETYKSDRIINFSHLSYINAKIQKSKEIKLTEQEKYEVDHEGRLFVERDGKYYILQLPSIMLTESGYYPDWDTDVEEPKQDNL